MGKLSLAGTRQRALVCVGPAVALAAVSAGIPVTLSLLTGVRGLGREGTMPLEPSALIILLWESFWVPALASALAVLIALPFNAAALFSHRLKKRLGFMLVILLFSNPVFFVFIWTFLWIGPRGPMGALLVAAYILTPLSAVLIESGIRSIPDSIVKVGRLSGASAGTIFVDIALPWIFPELILAWLLGYISALGFYLVPLYIGGARIRSATVWVHRALNQAGNPETAGVFALLVTGLAIVGIAIGGTLYFSSRKRLSRHD